MKYKSLDTETSFVTNYLKDKPHGWIQFKGIDLCMDVYCSCGVHTHIDGEFIYFIECSKCGKTYELNGHIELIERNRNEIDPAHSIDKTQKEIPCIKSDCRNWGGPPGGRTKNCCSVIQCKRHSESDDYANLKFSGANDEIGRQYKVIDDMSIAINRQFNSLVEARDKIKELEEEIKIANSVNHEEELEEAEKEIERLKVVIQNVSKCSLNKNMCSSCREDLNDLLSRGDDEI